MSVQGQRGMGTVAQGVGDHPAVETGARLGYAVNGVMHLVIAWLALQLATGQGAGNTDQSGALAALSSTTIGQLTIWIAVAGFALLAVWQVAEAVRPQETTGRAKAAAKAVLYGVLSITAWRFATGAGSSSKRQTVDVTAQLMHAPAGRILVALVGAAIIAVGGYHVHKGVTRRFLDDLRGHPGRAAEVAGQIGYAAKGVALIVVGILFGSAALHASPSESTGLDGALRKLLSLPFGQVLCAAVALGFAAFAVYSFARSRYAKV